ncbi:MAG TPA: DUF4232 domain-containing protein [Streptosporangiaceae bacterium]|nr:DUF4232 domain-containing protein [Streptosporangiaceae bacterium]
MKYLSTIPKTARRITAVIAAASAAGLIAVTASAAAPSGAVLAADAARTTATAVPACTAGDLGAWVAVTQGNGAAGSIFYPLQFTNLSRHACAMRGFPGVSAIDRHGHQLGSPAGWDHTRPVRTVVLAAGATAHATLRYSDATVATSPGCHPVSSMVELRVYPPNQRQATFAAFSMEACSHTGPVYLDVTPLQAGVGTRNG